jgi:hypothetical protein
MIMNTMAQDANYQTRSLMDHEYKGNNSRNKKFTQTAQDSGAFLSNKECETTYSDGGNNELMLR